MRIKLQPQQQPKPRPQRRRKQSRPRSRAHKRERLHIHGVRARRRPLPDHDVELVVLQRGIKNLFQRRLQPVHFIDEEHLPVVQIGKDGGQLTLDLQRGPRGCWNATASSLAMMLASVVFPSPGGP